ncbi:MAG: FmdB family zinc ribbon protein [Achromobacter sp.]
MPIYAYKCSACGHAKDVLQKISDAPLSVCPECGQSTFSKQVTAAGFQLKGSGWYVTDFRGNGNGGAAASTATSASGDGAAPAAAPAATPAPASAPAAASPAAGSPAAGSPAAGSSTA